MKKIKKVMIGIRYLWIFIWAQIFALIIYDRKYIKGKYFTGKYGNINASGWNWIYTDFMARLLFGINRNIPFPVSPRISVQNPNNIYFHVDDLNNFQGIGNYFQAFGNGKITIGKGCWIASNVGIITANHDVTNPEHHVEAQDVILGENCWIGMNSVILPGTNLGPHTTVGAGSIVTKSFPEGFCIIAGNPAKKIRDIQAT